MRGDRPHMVDFDAAVQLFTPHARGSTAFPPARPGSCLVYPACAGIDRGLRQRSRCTRCLPRMRGDRPHVAIRATGDKGFTPHARGSTLGKASLNLQQVVYPACAGIDLFRSVPASVFPRLPRMRGDRPLIACPHQQDQEFTPHARGSTCPGPSYPPKHSVYPACAGIDPGIKWRGIFPLRLPRMRGDRPTRASSFVIPRLFTPHARGSTLLARTSALFSPVYPACAGIDLAWSKVVRAQRRLPRMRGDRPYEYYNCNWELGFTPHARGSTSLRKSLLKVFSVYPACAGIDLSHVVPAFRR